MTGRRPSCAHAALGWATPNKQNAVQQVVTAYNRGVSAQTPNQIILASASPRRRQLLEQLGVAFEVRPSNVNEDPLPGETPLETQLRITRDKALAVTSPESRVPSADLATSYPGPGIWDSGLAVIACDTTVLLDGDMLNKPEDEAEAWSMLRRLRGRAHHVQSCLVVMHAGRVTDDVVVSEVVMRAYRDDEIAAYVATGDPFDKAGGYAVQHAQFAPVAHVKGCPLNVIGLPLCVLRERMAGLPECAPVCAAWSGAECPAYPAARGARVTPGARLRAASKSQP